MKKILLLLLIINCQLSINNCSAQSTILSFSTLPASPTTNDVVKVVASLSFTSGGCELSEQGHTTNASRTDAYALHCLGMLTVICPNTDTFLLGTLPAGDHTFVLSLSSGGGSPPCSPGIVIDDTDSITFTVDPGVGINVPNAKAVEFSLYPNPASTNLTLQTEHRLPNTDYRLQIYNAQGQLVHHSIFDIQHSTFDISNFPPGLYYLTLQSEAGVGVKKFEVMR